MKYFIMGIGGIIILVGILVYKETRVADKFLIISGNDSVEITKDFVYFHRPHICNPCTWDESKRQYTIRLLRDTVYANVSVDEYFWRDTIFTDKAGKVFRRNKPPYGVDTSYVFGISDSLILKR